MKNVKAKQGFTLIEMIVAIGLTGMLTTMATTMFIDIMKARKFIAMNEAVAQDSQIILNLLATEIQNNYVDYEEYYNWNVFGYTFGANYGEYAKSVENGFVKGHNAIQCFETTHCYQAYLALISPNGKTKKIFAPEYNKTLEERVVSVAELAGCDSNSDGVSEKFVRIGESCESAGGVNLTDAELSTVNILSPYGGDFYPISSMRANIIDLRFYVSPANDPHKAYAMPEYVYQPKVTIVLKMKPSKSHFGNAAEKMAESVFQTTITSRILSGVKS